MSRKENKRVVQETLGLVTGVPGAKLTQTLSSSSRISGWFAIMVSKRYYNSAILVKVMGL
jgi:hypothetical protein